MSRFIELRKQGAHRVPGPAEPRWDGMEQHLVSLLASSSFAAEQYRVLRHLVESMHKDRGLRVLAVTSSAIGDGKTTTAINLAGALAQAPETRVLLVDADLRRGAVQERLGLGDVESPGLVDAIVTPNTSLADVVRRCPPFGLSVLPAGRETAIPYEVLKSPRVGELFEEARQHYDYVVLDTPPFAPVPDCRVIAKCVDGFLLIVAAHKTPRKLVEAALDVMDPAQLVGLVFNGDTERPFARYYGHYATHGLSRNGHRTNWWSRVTKRGGDSRLRSEVSQ